MAEARIDAIMARVSLSNAVASTARARELRKAEVGDLLTALDSQVRSSGPEVVKEAWVLGRLAADAERWTKVFDPAAEFNQFDAEALRLLTDNMVNGLSDSIQTVGRQVDDVFRREALRQTVMQYARPQQAVDHADTAYERRLREQGIAGFVDRAGRQWKLSTYASMHMKTVKAEAANQAMANRMLARGFVLIRIDSHPNSCDLCKKYNGKVYSLVSGVEGYEYLAKLPPWHPNCTHFGTPDKASIALREKMFPV